MFKNILIATDGSELSEKAELRGVALAKAVGASVTAVTVTVPIDAYISNEIAASIDPSIFEERTARMAKNRLDAVAKRAAEAGVACSTIRVQDPYVYKGIINTAKTQGCDLIVMSSHGRGGISGLILGSETTKVLTHSTIPVLVCR